MNDTNSAGLLSLYWPLSWVFVLVPGCSHPRATIRREYEGRLWMRWKDCRDEVTIFAAHFKRHRDGRWFVCFGYKHATCQHGCTSPTTKHTICLTIVDCLRLFNCLHLIAIISCYGHPLLFPCNTTNKQRLEIFVDPCHGHDVPHVGYHVPRPATPLGTTYSKRLATRVRRARITI